MPIRYTFHFTAEEVRLLAMKLSNAPINDFNAREIIILYEAQKKIQFAESLKREGGDVVNQINDGYNQDAAIESSSGGAKASSYQPWNFD